jgi:hypothetical protein
MMFMMVPSSDKYESGGLPDKEVFVEMNKFNARLQEAGVLVELNGLQPTMKGAKAKNEGGKVSITDGPFTEANEIIGGYWMLDVKSKEEVLEWAKQIPGEGWSVQIRQLYEISDFPAEVQEVFVEAGAQYPKQMPKPEESGTK